ncbi:MAG: deoxynucleoside kinase [Saprospiraceae bacterium]|nr:deoxynucleoside kinase [Saprospiraceae bacterium]
MTGQFPYQYISIEGNIGSGKTSLSKKLNATMPSKLILEQFADNPFLPFFYQDPERYAFPVEIFFMTERQKQLQNQLINRDLFLDLSIADYFFPKTLIFAKNNLNQEEYKLFHKLFHILQSNMPNPDLLIYIHRSPDKLLQNIRKRGRSYEQGIDKSYLKSIQDSYFDFFSIESDFPVLIVEAEELDFLDNDRHYQEIINLFTKKFNPGVTYISIL